VFINLGLARNGSIWAQRELSALGRAGSIWSRNAMPIRIDRVSDDRYMARVTPSRYRDVHWSTEQPVSAQALVDTLVELGYHLQDIADALDEADSQRSDP
jgi:Holliday junction resolvasome RuvABC DNA-binding subunit